MSAWLCSEEHIGLIVSADPDGDAKAFAMLVKENIRSLEARYPGRDFLAEWKRDAKKFRFQRGEVAAIIAKGMDDYQRSVCGRWRKPAELSPVVLQTQIVKACECYDYQACETRDYRSTPAAAYVEKVRQAAIAAGGETTGKLYDAMVWGL